MLYCTVKCALWEGLAWIGGEVSRFHFFIEVFFGRALVATIRYFLQEDQITFEVVDTNQALNLWDHFFNFCDNRYTCDDRLFL